jgi:hypothetical protein
MAEDSSSDRRRQGSDLPADGLFDRFLDDAAMFPPGNADAATAIVAHLGYRTGAMDRFVGPLLVHVNRWLELASAHATVGSPHLDVVVVGTTRPPDHVPGLQVVGFELPVASLPLPPAADGLSVACEVQPGDDGLEVLEAVASASDGHYPGKFRTGGTTTEAFPDEAAVARFVVSGVRAGAPMKFTAGLHHAVRFRDPITGFEHHGFLNLLVAVKAALSGASRGETAALLANRDAQRLAGMVRTWTPDEAEAVRKSFVSFGCCGVVDPVRELVDLGLVAPEESP